LARAKTRAVLPLNAVAEPQMFELSSRANLLASVLSVPPREGLFQMETTWRISFDRTEAGTRTIVIITVPAYGNAEPTAEVHSYDKHGRPRKV
jgi:hypothetical protein